MIYLAFEKFDISRIFATPFGNNTASYRVLEKTGFILEARFEKIVFKNNEMLDELVYTIRR
jgi:[ribosomal protein S5]-alanine N-acetyltransferase